MKKKVPSELVYILAILIMSLSVAMITSTDYGVSMIVAPAYIISLKIPFLTFGQSEYVVQGLLFIVFCILMKKIRLVYFCSFLTGLIYGATLDMWRSVIPHFNPEITPVGSLPTRLKIVYFIVGMATTSFAVALFFKTYIYPQVYDFFVKGISKRYNIALTKFKVCFDVTSLVASCALSLILFGGFVGVGIGTLIMTAFNGIIIGLFSKLLDKFFEFRPFFIKFAKNFEL